MSVYPLESLQAARVTVAKSDLICDKQIHFPRFSISLNFRVVCIFPPGAIARSSTILAREQTGLPPPVKCTATWCNRNATQHDHRRCFLPFSLRCERKRRKKGKKRSKLATESFRDTRDFSRVPRPNINIAQVKEAIRHRGRHSFAHLSAFVNYEIYDGK